MKEYIKEYIKENKNDCIIDLLSLILMVITGVLVNDITVLKICFIPIICLIYFRLFLTDVFLSKSLTLNKDSLEFMKQLEFMNQLITDLEMVTQKKVENENPKEKDVNKV